MVKDLMKFEKRKGFKVGNVVRFQGRDGSGVGRVAELHHASAIIARDEGGTAVARYSEMMRI